MKQPTKEQFLKDVATHQMHVKLDQGVYRHLEFRQADGMWTHGFNIVTYPWHLVISGDMGTWVFSRLEDMLQFFRTDDGQINADYWAEKVQNGVDGHSDSWKVYDGDAYQERLIESLEDYDLTEEHKALVIEELNSLEFDDEHWIISQIRDFEVFFDKGDSFKFQDVWEIDMKAYSYHYIWCCYAIAWAVEQYDARPKG